MPVEEQDRYAITCRANEARQVMDWIRARGSDCVVVRCETARFTLCLPLPPINRHLRYPRLSPDICASMRSSGMQTQMAPPA
jgi:hypothetical protein